MKRKIVILFLLLFLVCGCSKSNNKVKENISYEITIKDSDNIISTTEVKKGELLEQPDDPVKDGFIFIRWVLNGETFDFSKPVEEDAVIEAEWRAVNNDETEYVVKFNSDGGTTIANQIVKEGENIIKPTDPVKEGYTFLGWGINGNDYDFYSEVDENLILTAIWKKNDASSTNGEDSLTLETPRLSSTSNDNSYAELTVIDAGEYDVDGNKDNLKKFKLEGWELYEKDGDTYNKIDDNTSFDNIKVNIELGSTRVFVARVYRNDVANKIYSDYSNELTFSNKLSTPKLISKETSDNNYSLNVSYNGSTNPKNLNGWEIYEKVNGKFQLLKSSTKFTENVSLSLTQGESRTFKCRVYALNSKDKKVYSYYSSEVTIEESIKKPTIILSGYNGVFHNGVYGEDIFVSNWEDYENGNTGNIGIGGWEVYEKTQSGYSKIDEQTTAISANIEVNAGTKKTIVIRMYTLNKSNQRVYSDYSNEVIIDGTLNKPTINKSGYEGSFSNGVYVEDIVVSNWNSFTNGSTGSIGIGGWEVYEKTQSGYNKIDEQTTAVSTAVEISAGTKKTIVVRMYTLNKSNQRVYSDYSNEVIIDGTITKPTINKTGYEGSFSNGVYGEDIVISNWNSFTNGSTGSIGIGGWEIYEKTQSGYSKIDEQTTAISANIEVNAGTKKTIVIRMYTLNKSNQRVYSDYSNEVIIDGTLNKPTINKSGYGGSFDGSIYTDDIFVSNWEDFENGNTGSIGIGGWEIYEKTQSGYNKIDEQTTAVSASIEISAGTKKTIVIRMYTLNKSNQRVYSDYSNEVIIDGTNN